MKKPVRCQECVHYYSAGRSNPSKELEQYNYWCCAKGAPAPKSINWCIILKKREIKNEI